jgi:hypothetical protein
MCAAPPLCRLSIFARSRFFARALPIVAKIFYSAPMISAPLRCPDQ